MRLLVIEDDRKVASFLQQGLREEGYAVDVAYHGNEANVKAHVYDYDALIVDIMLPGKSGLEILDDLRREGRDVPALVLTARDSTEDIVRGLDAGADDYLTKPFSFAVLLARMRALLRRGGTRGESRLMYGGVELDRRKHTASRNGRGLQLTAREFQLLEYFLARPGQVIGRPELLEKVWDLQLDPMSNVVDVHMGNLRRKLRRVGATELLHTVRGVGYMLHAKHGKADA